MAELVNKINGPWFSKFDEDLATAFSIYCGISIAHVSGDRGRASARRSALLFTLAVLALSRPVCDRPESQSPAAGLLCNLQCLLVTSGLNFPSKNLLFPVLFHWPPRTMGDPSYYSPTPHYPSSSGSNCHPSPSSASFWEMLGLIVQSWQLWPGTPTHQSLTLSFILLLFLCCGPWGRLQRACKVPDGMLRDLGRRRKGTL